MHSRFKRLLAGGSIVVALGAITFLVVYFVGTQGEDQPAREGDQLTRGRLLVSSRPHLRVCVDGAAGYEASDADVQAVRRALDAALASLPAVPAEYSEPQVNAGCPTPPAALTDETMPPVDRAVVGTRAQIVDAASPHRTWVYILPEDRYRALFGEFPSLGTSSECFLRGDVCYPVTFAVYLPASAGEDVLREALLSSLGFGTLVPQPTPDWRPCELGTPIPLCEPFYEGWLEHQGLMEERCELGTPHPLCVSYQEWMRDVNQWEVIQRCELGTPHSLCASYREWIGEQEVIQQCELGTPGPLCQSYERWKREQEGLEPSTP